MSVFQLGQSNNRLSNLSKSSAERGIYARGGESVGGIGG